jgi:hypothetical protein
MIKELKPHQAVPGRGSLRPLTFNAKKWRKENGYTTPEWEMYAKNIRYKTIILCTVSFIFGMVM